MAKDGRKTRKALCLSVDTMHYLESLRKGKPARSISAVLEDLIREWRDAEEMERISRSVAGYYGSLTEDEMAPDQAWGQFSEKQ